MASEFKKITKELESNLDSKRFEHTLGVAYTAASMAMAYGMDVKTAQLAGLLHDCAKAYSDEKKLSLCEKYGLTISDVERENPGLLHAKLGSYLAKKKYDVEDQDVLNAIEFHTTGRPDMSCLEQIVFIADYIEPSRKPLPDIDTVRKLAFTDLDKCMYKILKDTLDYLGTGNKAVDPMTQKTFDFYSKLLKEE